MQRLPKRLVDGSQLTAVAATYYTTPANTITTISAATLTNTTAGAVTATVHLVPSGGSATAANCILPARVISAGEPYTLGPGIAHSMAAGGSIVALAGAGASISILVSGYETNP